MIKFKNYRNMAFSLDDARSLVPLIDAELEKNEKVVIDFTGIMLYTSMFFNNVFSKYILSNSPEWFDDHIEVTGLTEAGESSFKHSYENAIEYYKIPLEERLKRDEILQKYMSDIED